jgi:GNAT superfamily N-acetyltransferase
MSGLVIRTARTGDEDLVLKLLYELADYEKLTDKFRLTREIIARDFFGEAPACFCEIASAGAEPVGVMTWYRTYASFSASRGVFLEDLFVRLAHRGKGYGKALLGHLAKRAVVDGAAHVDWFVLDWNKPSIEFYDRLRAEPVTGWLSYRLSGQALKNLARS